MNGEYMLTMFTQATISAKWFEERNILKMVYTVHI